MPTFDAQAASASGTGTSEKDSTGGLFAPGYLFGERLLPIDRNPGFAQAPDTSSLSQGEPQNNWETLAPPEMPYVPVAAADGAWYYWSGVVPLIVKVPDKTSVRSIWIPNFTGSVSISLAGVPGFATYTATATSEMIPVPDGNTTVTLSANAPFATPIAVFVTHRLLDPSRTVTELYAILATDPKLLEGSSYVFNTPPSPIFQGTNIAYDSAFLAQTIGNLDQSAVGQTTSVITDIVVQAPPGFENLPIQVTILGLQQQTFLVRPQPSPRESYFPLTVIMHNGTALYAGGLVTTNITQKNFLYFDISIYGYKF